MVTTETYLVIDEGTSSVKAFLFGQDEALLGVATVPLKRQHPRRGWVEQHPAEIVRATRLAVRRVVARLSGRIQIVAAGITNQRETTIAWDAVTGRAFGSAIVWEDTRTAAWCRGLAQQAGNIHTHTGLSLSPYFSASKMAWMLAHRPAVVASARQGRLRFGTVDSWLAWHMTKEQAHVTDRSNASRTLLASLTTGAWQADLLDLFGIPAATLPKILPSVASFGTLKKEWCGRAVPLRVLAGDQQASLAAAASQPGDTKITFGTGLFVDQFLGTERVLGKRFMTSIAATGTRTPRYLAETYQPGAGAQIDAALGNPARLERAVRSLAGAAARLLKGMPLPVRRLTIDGGGTRDGLLARILTEEHGLTVRVHATFHGTALGVARLLQKR